MGKGTLCGIVGALALGITTAFAIPYAAPAIYSVFGSAAPAAEIGAYALSGAAGYNIGSGACSSNAGDKK